MRYQLVLWDFDGTLADTLAQALQIYNRLAAKKRFVPITDPQAVRQMGMQEFLKSHGVPLHQVPFAFTRFLKELRRSTESVALFDGIPETLTMIAGLGVVQGVVSSNSTENISHCLKANQVGEHFAYVSGTSRIFGKAKRLKTALRKLAVAADRTLYVGDEIRDIEAAQEAGMDIAAVSWGLNSAEALDRHGPTHLIAHPRELPRLLTTESESGSSRM